MIMKKYLIFSIALVIFFAICIYLAVPKIVSMCGSSLIRYSCKRCTCVGLPFNPLTRYGSVNMGEVSCLGKVSNCSVINYDDSKILKHNITK